MYAKEIFMDEKLFLSEVEGVLSSQKEVAFTLKTKDDRTLETTSMPLFRGEQFSGKVVYVEDITSTISKKRQRNFQLILFPIYKVLPAYL